VHLCLHNRPGTFEHWFNPDVLIRFRRLVPALHASGRVAFTASNTRFAGEHAMALGLPAEAVSPWFPGVTPPPVPAEPPAGPVRVVALVCRLSPEKLPIVRAAADFVAAGLTYGADARLDVHGDGPAERAVRGVLAERLPGDRYRLLGATAQPLEAVAAADTVVNGGRAAIEGLMLGRRVVTP
jgi:hypothetical protein